MFTILALGLMVWSAPIVHGAQYLNVNGQDVNSITLKMGQGCIVEVVSDDSTPYNAYVGFDNGLVLGVFFHLETVPLAGDLASATDYDVPAFRGYYISAAGSSPAPSAGIHFVFEYMTQQLGVTDLKLYDSTFTSVIDSVHITVIPTSMGTAFTCQGRLMDDNSPADGLYDLKFKLYDNPDPVFAVQLESTIDINDFDVKQLSKHLKHDFHILEKIYEIVDEDTIPPEKDAKLQKLREILKASPLKKGKVLIFSESAETVDYLYNEINPKLNPEIQKASSGRENKNRLVRLFSPVANKYELKKSETEVRMVISTDVLSEGLNLQDCDKLINYDLHWNPVKLIQRFGRIDRIGSEHDQIYGFNFLPETELDRNLNLHEIVHNRIQEIHDTIGEDAEILDNTEELNSEAMYAIYEGDDSRLSEYEGEQEYLDINEAEEILRQIRDNDPEEYSRIANLRDGIRTAKNKDGKHTYVFCKAGKGNNRYSQFYLLDKKANIISRDIGEILGKIRADKDAPGFALPKGYNDIIEKIQKIFNEEVYSRVSEQKHASSLTQAQQYILRELRLIFEKIDSEDLKSEINLYDRVYRQVDRIAVKSELNKIRKHGLTGKQLIKKLQEIYIRHNLSEIVETTGQPNPIIPKVICSEFL